MPAMRRFRWLLEWTVPAVRRGIQQNQQLLRKAAQAVDARLTFPSTQTDLLGSVVELHMQKPADFTREEVVTEAYSAM